MKLSKVNLGLIGFGGWVQAAYLPTLESIPNVEIVGVAARSETSREHARELLGSEILTTGNYRELLCDSRVDAVMVAVPNALHREVALQAIKQGKHLFLELPIALNRQDVEAVLEAAESTDRVVQFDFELRYMPVAKAIEDRVRRGDVGRPLSASVDLMCNWAYGGGSFHEPSAREGFYPWLGAWYLDMLDIMLYGPSPTRVEVMGGRAMNGPMFDHGHALIEYDNGTVGRLSHSLISTRSETSVTGNLLGDEGELFIDFQQGILIHHSRDGAVQEENHPPKQPVYGWAGMRESIESFVSAITEGTPVKADANLARRIHQAVFACHEADAHARVT